MLWDSICDRRCGCDHLWEIKSALREISLLCLSPSLLHRTCLMKGSCLSELSFYLPDQLALATSSIQQMFIEPEFKLIPLIFSVMYQEIYSVSQEQIIFCGIIKIILNINVPVISVLASITLNSWTRKAGSPRVKQCETCL